MANRVPGSLIMHRREFIGQATALLSISAVAPEIRSIDRGLRVGVCTDLHYADIDTRGSRHYRLGLDRLRDAVEAWNRSGVDMVIHLGDLIDAGARTDADAEEGYLRAAAHEIKKAHAPRYYVLGNHCVATIKKARFLRIVGQRRAHLSFNRAGYHHVILDGCYRRDGVAYDEGPFDWTDADIPDTQRRWLADDLARTRLPTLVYVHQRLDLPADHPYAIHSADEIRSILERSRRVVAVVMGHSHDNDLRRIGGIAYITLAAMVEGPREAGSAFGVLHATREGSVRLVGSGRLSDHPAS